MKAAVVGAGAWGLPAAAQLARRGHDVTLVEAYEIGHPYASSSGDTRLWRISHTDALMVRLGLRAVDAWKQIERETGTTILLPRGLLWRGSSAPDVADALVAQGVAHTVVDAADVGSFFPGLRPNGSGAVWQSTAGPLWAAESLRAHRELFLRAAGKLREHTTLTDVIDRGDGLDLVLNQGGRREVLGFDVVVFTCGPRTSEILPALGIDIDLEPVLEQVSYFAGVQGVDTAWLPGFYDGPTDEEPGLYAMPVPGVGYKLGLDLSIRAYDPVDNDRAPNSERTAEIEDRVTRDFSSLAPTALNSMVCSWTDSPDGRFIIDSALGGRAVLACGDSGTGFKFSALMGHILSDLAEGSAPDADVGHFGFDRLAHLPADGSAKRFLQ